MSHWKQRKPLWVIELRESAVLLTEFGHTAKFKTKKEAKARVVGLGCLRASDYRIVKVWVKYEEVKP